MSTNSYSNTRLIAKFRFKRVGCHDKVLKKMVLQLCCAFCDFDRYKCCVINNDRRSVKFSQYCTIILFLSYTLKTIGF